MEDGDRFGNRVCHYACGVDEKTMDRRIRDAYDEDSYSAYKEKRGAGQGQVRDFLSWKFFLRWFRQANYSESWAARCWKLDQDEGERPLQAKWRGKTKYLMMPVEDVECDFSDSADEVIEGDDKDVQGRQASYDLDAIISGNIDQGHQSSRGRSRSRSFSRAMGRSVMKSEAPSRYAPSPMRSPSATVAGSSGARNALEVDASHDVRSKSPSQQERSRSRPQKSPVSSDKKEPPKKKEPMTKERLQEMMSQIESAPSSFSESVEMEKIQVIMTNYVFGFFEVVLVEGSQPEVWLSEASETVGHMQKIKNLQIGPIQGELQKARDALTSFRQGIGEWAFPCDFQSLKLEFILLVSSYQKCIDRFVRIKESVVRATKEYKQKGVDMKSQWRNKRDKYRYYYESKDVPPALAKLVADILYSVAADPYEVGISLDLYSPICAVDLEAQPADLSKPFMIPVQSDEHPVGEEKWLSRVWQNVYKSHLVAARQKASECLGVMTAPGNKSNCAIGTIPGLIEPNLSPGGDAEDGVAVGKHVWPSVVKGLRHAIWCSHPDVFEPSLESWPFRCLDCYLTVYSGRCVIVLVDATNSCRIGEPAQWLAKADVKALDGYPAWLCIAGSTIHCPVGSVPLIVGISEDIDITDVKVTLPKVQDAKKGKKAKEGKSEEYYALGVMPCFDGGWLKKQMSTPVRNNTMQAWVRAQTWIPPSWKSNEAVKQWKKSMEEMVGDIDEQGGGVLNLEDD